MFIGESGGGVQKSVSARRHLTAPNNGCDTRENPPLARGAVLIPAAQIHVVACLCHVALDHPRDWRDVTVPGPIGRLGMAVLARMLQYVHDTWVGVCTYEKRFV